MTLKHSRNYQGHWRKTPGRVVGVGFILLYQLTLSGFIGNSCRHLPTCSEYGYEAFARHGFLNGFWLTMFRVMRCGPGGTCGIDNVPHQVPRIAWLMPWSLWHFGKHAHNHDHSH